MFILYYEWFFKREMLTVLSGLLADRNPCRWEIMKSQEIHHSYAFVDCRLWDLKNPFIFFKNQLKETDWERVMTNCFFAELSSDYIFKRSSKICGIEILIFVYA